MLSELNAVFHLLTVSPTPRSQAFGRRSLSGRLGCLVQRRRSCLTATQRVPRGAAETCAVGVTLGGWGGCRDGNVVVVGDGDGGGAKQEIAASFAEEKRERVD